MAKKTLLFMVLFVSVVFLVNIQGACFAQPTDDTGINKRDQSKEELTAEQQGGTKQDLAITQQIRRAIVKSLSTYAHNVKIITVGGMVTLKGPVRSTEEKRTIEGIAAQVVGNDKIKSEIDIAP